MSVRRAHAVVVAYHAADQLSSCLDALQREVPVTVVDNSSSGEVAAVAQRHGATYVDAGANRGFAAGVNIALSRLATENVDVLLLNPDAVLTPSAVRELGRFLHRPENHRVAVVAPRLRVTNGEEQRVRWPFPTPARMCTEAVGFGRLPARRAFVVGAVALLRREAIEAVGGFDERFFLYAEEADWQRRALARGWTSAVCNASVAEHMGGGTSTNERKREMLFHAAQEIYIRKWYGRSGWLLYRTAALSGAAARATVLRGERRKDAVRRLHLYVRGPCRCAALRSG
jgi:GT2 family glycosyltransferase